MHAFIIIGKEKETIDSKIDSLLKKLAAERLDFSLTKIADVRNLGSFTMLKTNKKIGIVAENIQDATIEALNAFLKILEEPQENIFFLLTANNEYSLPQTIISRCSIIRVTSERGSKNIQFASEFIKKSTGEKLIEIDKYKKKGAAIDFMEQLILGLHAMLYRNVKLSETAKLLKLASLTRAKLRANGNVNLQLSKFVIASDRLVR